MLLLILMLNKLGSPTSRNTQGLYSLDLLKLYYCSEPRTSFQRLIHIAPKGKNDEKRMEQTKFL